MLSTIKVNAEKKSLLSVLSDKRNLDSDSVVFNLLNSKYSSRNSETLDKINYNLNKIISNLDSSVSDEILLKNLSNEIYKQVKYKENSVYPQDFASSTPSANCVGYATIFADSLYYINRRDLLKRANVNANNNHVWLEFDLNRSTFEFNKQDQYPQKIGKIDYLIPLNENSLGNKFVRQNNYKYAMDIFRKISKYGDDFDIGGNNAEVMNEDYLQLGYNINNRMLIDPQCSSCNTTSGRRCFCPCPIHQLAAIIGRDDSVWGGFCLLCLHSC
jgi:hypothetical protein